ncbi:mechanosensitive ion channel family protein [Dyella sp.]|uniref:mechanosensitive ion channel family protein n=1 Tax=Dyella sp. TaxID=1869338 RepID=UPI002D7694CC|nr:mechanosensitive ion channel domain-containing protein [Dyella sp.]HET6431862.1 mechanosensitive ion channel domain-containing protein [Dyella sp.]
MRAVVFAPTDAAATAPASHDFSFYLDQATQIGLHVVEALVVLLLGIWVARRIAHVAEGALGRAKLDVTLTSFLRNLLYGVLIALLLVYVLQILRVPSAPLVAALGAAGLAIGLSLQGSLSNLAWGVLLALFRPFRVGDFVDIGGTLGSVDAINLMYTQLVMPDGREAVIPNAKVGADAIINFNRRGTRRFELTVGIGYKDSIGAAIAEIERLFEADPRILKDPAPGVWTNALGESSVDLVIRAWATSADFWAAQTDLLRAIKESFDAAGISIPFPQRELTVVQGSVPVTTRPAD